MILRVIPSVDENGEVMLEIHPEVSTGTIDPLTGIPSQTTTEVTTQMIVPDGQTVFVGGLIKHRIEESKSGVPVVSRIPLVGRLFSNRNYIQSNTETIVLITPTVVRSDEANVDEDIQDRIDEIELRQNEHIDSLAEEMDVFFRSN